ncbi:MAG: SUMF1/EgtB/PvdO family nonheme iron enzyme [Archangium sp.]|nr:SUMF1/EgtB/PvdO family nonheme iron enzyme [Archangium sp.]
MQRTSLFAAALCLAACGTMIDPGDDAGTTFDAGTPSDAGMMNTDAGSDDAGVDAGAVDAGVDSGVEDAGVDAGLIDAGTDAGTPDAGPTDAGSFCSANGLPGTCMQVTDCYGTRQPIAGFCPGPSNIQCCTPRYAVACDPNVVQQPNAGLNQLPSDGGCVLPGMVRIGAAFCIDQYEGSLLEVLDGGVTQPWSPYINPGTRVLRAQSTPNAVPQGYITQLQAGAACSGAGKRLCTDAEWLRACRGPNSRTYPYGNTRMNGVCNDARSQHPAVELYGTNASWIYSHIDSPCLNQLQPGLDRNGTNSGCITEEGVFDMMGNLHEWTADPNGTFRGGFYVDTVINGNGCLYATTAHTVTHWDYSTGFRCCSDN